MRAKLRPQADADGEDDDVDLQCVVHGAGQRGADHAIDQQRGQDGGERQLHVGDAHQQRVDHAAGVAGEQADGDAEDDREDHRSRSRPAG